MWSFVLLACIYFPATINALCSWNRASVPASSSDNAKTMNFVNGKWTQDTSQSSGATFNGQKYWKKTQYDNCYVSTLWLYYYKGSDDGEYQWLISPTFASTPSSAYVQCSLDMPNPVNPAACNGNWVFAPDGVPNSNSALYEADTEFYIKAGDCPQVLCEEITFAGDANDFYEGIYIRSSTNDQQNLNVYEMDSSQSISGTFYLYFQHEMFVWIVNEYLVTDCQAATSGQVTAISTVGEWGLNSATSGNIWYFNEPGSIGTYTRYLTCSGQIPTTSPSASDSAGYPTTTTTLNPSLCGVFPSYCDPAATPAPTTMPTTPTVSWPTVPTAPTSPTPAPTVASGQSRLQLNWHTHLMFLIFIASQLFV